MKKINVILFLISVLTIIFVCTACKHEHIYGEWYTTKEATCTSDGRMEQICKCGQTREQNIAAKGHTVKGWEIALFAKCTEGGLLERYCDNCDYSEQKATQPKGHSFNEWRLLAQATCTEDGVYNRICTRCEEEELQNTESLGHALRAWEITQQFSCNTDEIQTQECERCDYSQSKVTKQASHTFGEWVITRELSCTESEICTRGCSACGIEEHNETKLPSGHIETTLKSIAPTCDKNGLTEGKICATCSEILVKQQTVSALGHAWNQGEVTKAPGCVINGVKTFSCSRCSHTKNEAVAALGHKPSADWTVEKASTCTSVGSKHRKCTACGEKCNITQIDKIQHKYGEGIVTKEPLCNAKGVRTFKCVNCVHERTETIGYAAHKNDGSGWCDTCKRNVNGIFTVNGLAQVREPKSNLVQTPSIVTYVMSQDDLNGILSDSPAVAIMYINSSLEVLDKNGNKISTVAQAMQKLGNKVIPAFYVSDNATLNAICTSLNNAEMIDAYVVSNKPELVGLARSKYSTVRGIVDFSNRSDLSLSEIRSIANTSGARVVMISPAQATKKNIDKLQRLYTTTWVQSASDSTAELVSYITMGANGIVTQNRKRLENCFTAFFEKNTIIHTTNTIGHRGQPSTNQENSIASYQDACDAGATLIEVDVFLTKDDVLVAMHSRMIAEVTTGTGNVEDCTLAQLQQYVINANKNVPTQPIPTIEDVFKEFKGKDIQLAIDIKSTNEKTYKLLAELIQKYDMQDQVNIAILVSAEIYPIKKYMKNIAVMYMSGDIIWNKTNPNETLEYILKVVERFDVSLGIDNLPTDEYGKKMIRALRHRGVTIATFTVNNRKYFDEQIMCGIEGIITDYSTYASGYVRGISASQSHYELNAGVGGEIPITVTSYDWAKHSCPSAGMAVISGNSSAITYNNGILTANEAGEYTVIFNTVCKVSTGNTYRVVSEPVKIVVK